MSESSNPKKIDPNSGVPASQPIVDEKADEAAVSAMPSVVLLAFNWEFIKTLLGWEGFSFVVLLSFAIGFIAMGKFLAARIFFSLAAIILAAKLVSSSSQYLSTEWIGRGKIGAVLLCVVFLLGMFYWVSSEETKAREKQAEIDTQLRATQFAAALDDPIASIVIVLTLRQPVEFEQICPLEFGFQVLGDGPRLLLTSVHDDTLTAHSPDGTTHRLSSYRISWLLEDEPKAEIRSFLYGEGRRTLTKIVLPVPYRAEQVGQPFAAVRNFRNILFQPWLPHSLVERVSKIELLVNGWVLVDANPSTVHWEPQTANWRVFEQPVELDTPWTTDFHQQRPPRGLWRADFERVPMRRNEATLPW